MCHLEGSPYSQNVLLKKSKVEAGEAAELLRALGALRRALFGFQHSHGSQPPVPGKLTFSSHLHKFLHMCEHTYTQVYTHKIKEYINIFKAKEKTG